MGQENIRIDPEERKAYFGPLYPLIEDNEITDIDYNGREVWVTDCENERWMSELHLEDDFVDQFTKRISNAVSRPFHKMSPVLEAETDTLRITIVHESVCQGARCFCIRKSLPSVRLTEESAVETGYLSPEMLYFLKNCVRARMNLVFAGNPGVGKTECAKFFSRYITDRDRVITIEDNPEWHYSSVNPGKDCIEMKISPSMDYTRAIKTCLRLNPTWMFLSEARSTEVRYLLEGLSTGVKGMTTLHTDDVRKIPDRIVNMAGAGNESERILNDTYSFMDVGVLLKRKEVRDASGFTCVRRYVDQICFFSREEEQNRIFLMAEDGAMVQRSVPEYFQRRFLEAGIGDPFAVDGMLRVEAKPVHRTKHKNTYEEIPEYVGRVAENDAGNGRGCLRTDVNFENRPETDSIEESRPENYMYGGENRVEINDHTEKEEMKRYAEQQEMEQYLNQVTEELSNERRKGATCLGNRTYDRT